jgi:tyrosine-protein kinase Etk/Wzc
MSESLASNQPNSGSDREGSRTEANANTGRDDPGRIMDGLDLAVLLSRHRKLIVVVTIACAILAGVAAMLLPGMYSATTTLFPPTRIDSVAKSLLGNDSLLTGFSGSDLGLINPTGRCIALLKSRSVQDAIVDEFDLRRLYSVKRYEDARRKLDDRSQVMADKEGTISIAVDDPDPKRAADIANAYVDQLRLLNWRLSKSEAEERRTFYEQQLSAEREALSAVETSLEQVQEKTGLIQPDTQGRSIIDAVANLHAQVATAEVKVQTMHIYAAPDNPDLKRAEVELQELREQLAQLERSVDKLGEGKLEIPTRRLPEVELQYGRELRELKYHQTLFDLLGREVQAARIDEAQPGYISEVIDTATVPETRSGPSRAMLVLVTACIAFFASCLSILLREYVKSDPDKAARFSLLLHSLKWNRARTSSPWTAESGSVRLAFPGAAVELCVLAIVLSSGIVAFELGWMSAEQAAGSTAVFLLCLDALAWKRFDHGRHPCFLFLCILTLVQSGRFIAYLFGNESYPLRIAGVAPHPFDLTRAESGTVLSCLALSALCVYAICRWNYTKVSPPPSAPVARYLPYLYTVFYGTLPFQVYKNYAYYHFIKAHGGYLYFWVHHGDIVSSVPLFVRAIVLMNAPAFLAIFVFECRKKRLYFATACYLSTTIPALLVGFRSSAFVLVLVLWYVAKIKSTKNTRLVALAALALVLVILGGVIKTIRESSNEGLSSYTFAPIEFVKLEGDSIDVTSVAVKYNKMLAPYALSYLWYDLQDAFVLRTRDDYVRGQRLPNDVTVLLSPIAFARGRGEAGSYIAQMYLLGGVVGVIVLSLLLGGGLHLLSRWSRNAYSLFVVASILPVVFLMPRGQLLDWASDLLKTGLFVVILWSGWLSYCTILWLLGSPVLVTLHKGNSMAG